MAFQPDWQREDYRNLLHLQVRLVQIGPQYRSRFDSSDLVQDTMKRAIENQHQFRGETQAQFIGWLQAILRNTVNDKIQKENAQKRSPGMEFSMYRLDESSAKIEKFLAADQTSPSGQVERKEQLFQLATAVEKLPKDQRDVVIRRDLNGDSIKQIARELAKTEKQIAGLLLRGRQMLRRWLIREE